MRSPRPVVSALMERKRASGHDDEDGRPEDGAADAVRAPEAPRQAPRDRRPRSRGSRPGGSTGAAGSSWPLELPKRVAPGQRGHPRGEQPDRLRMAAAGEDRLSDRPPRRRRPPRGSTTRVANSRTNSTSCVVTRSVRPSLASRASDSPELAAARRIERRRRLVHQEQRRVHRERPRDRDALRLAARELARQRRRARVDAEAREERAGARLGRLAPRLRATWTGASVTLSSAVRCSKRPWCWKTIPTLRRSARAPLAAGAAPGRRRHAVDVDRRRRRTPRGPRPPGGPSSCRRPRAPSAPRARRRGRQIDAPEDGRAAAREAEPADREGGGRHAVDAFHRPSSRRARRESGSDIAR